MPKRTKTPPPGDDEPRYFTVCQPYPLNANWELLDDQISCARWIAEIIGPQFIYALMHKPSARGMVLIEVDRNFKETHLLLGEHRWRELLTNPTHEQEERFSQIYHSTYNSNREAQKDGWKRLHVRDKWFKGYTFHSGKEFRRPYPQTHWCPTPLEDRTDKPMCRPLPTAVKPPPAVPAPPVVGSTAWLQVRSSPNPNNPVAVRGAWAARGRGGTATTATARSNVTARSPSTSALVNTSAPALLGNDAPVQVTKSTSTNSSATPTNLNPLNRNAGAWGKGQAPFPIMPTTTNANAPPAASAASKKAAWGAPNPQITTAGSSIYSTSTTTSNAAPPKGVWGTPNPKVKSVAATVPEPNLTVKVITKAATEKPEPPVSTINVSNVPPLPSMEASGSSGSSSSSKFSWADDVDGQMEELEIARRDDVVIRRPLDLTLTGDPLDDLLGNDEEDEYSLPMGTGGITAISSISQYPKVAEGVIENLWADHDDEEEVVEEFVCPVHGANPKICKKGICKERADYEKKKSRMEKEQQKGKDKDKKTKGSKSKNRSSSRGTWRKKASRSRSHSENRNATPRNDTPSSDVTPVPEAPSVWF